MVDTSLPVVVGIDGTDASNRALRYAVGEARRHGVGLTLVHAISETQPIATPVALYNVEAFEKVSQRLVAEAEREVRELEPGLKVRTVVTPGPRARVLAEAGQQASMIVVGHRIRSLASRVLTHSTATGLAARAHLPVVVVPEAWTEPERPGLVVVGVDEAVADHDALAVAFEEAAARRSKLVVLHAWRLPTAYDELLVSQVAVEDWQADAAGRLRESLAPLLAEHPDVEVEFDVRHEHPAYALAKASKDADAVVVGRRAHHGPAGTGLGSTVRTLIHESLCPVIVAPRF